jgi:hypothetical protein
VALWLPRPPPDQKIPRSNPARVQSFQVFMHFNAVVEKLNTRCQGVKLRKINAKKIF